MFLPYDTAPPHEGPFSSQSVVGLEKNLFTAIPRPKERHVPVSIQTPKISNLISVRKLTATLRLRIALIAGDAEE